jgi:cephalosporin-C deacetylase-like acetyl esterase
MTRRDLFALSAARRIEYRDYSRCLPDYLSRLAKEAVERREKALSAARTPAGIRNRQSHVRETFWRMIGGQPERTPLNIRTAGEFDRPAYRVERLVYESRPGFHVPANLYIPKNARPPYPGVLFQMGHSLNGKAAAPYQYCCQGLVQLGFLVLAFDPMGQGERTYYPNRETGLTSLGSADNEHTLPGKQLLLVGDSSTRLQAWDAVRSLDVLAAHPLVDPKRLASTGQSGGGTLTMLLAAVDDRLACAAITCANTENHAIRNFNPPGSTDDAEQNLMGGGREGIDRWDLLWPLAPKPLLVAVSARDSFGTYSPRYLENGREEFARLENVYRTLEATSKIAWYETPMPHSLALDMRLEIYRWFSRWLQDRGEPVTEPEVRAEEDRALWVSETGNVVRSFASKTPQVLAKEQLRDEPVSPNAELLRKLLAMETPPEPRLVEKGSVPSRGCRASAIEVGVTPEVTVPAWLFAPLKGEPRATVIVLEPGGRSARWGEDALYQQLAARGFTVCAPDVRGIGDLAPEFPRHSARHAAWHQTEEAYAWASLMLGKPMLGQRVTDLIAVTRALGASRVTLAASGRMTVPTLFAAALEPRIGRVVLSGGVASFRSLVEAAQPEIPTANIIPGILRHFDLPQLEAKVRPVRIEAAEWTVDGLERAVTT